VNKSVRERYHRSIDGSGEDSLSKLARWIQSDSTVLDVGAATGVLGALLSQRDCLVDGVERDLSAAARARKHYRHLVIADLDVLDLMRLVPEHHYDYIVFADVLEHLADPRRTLRQAVGFLTPGGHVLISAPNVAYTPLVAELLANRFEYRESGILDRTHRWFFTRPSLERLVRSAGLRIVGRAEVLKAAHESEFGTQFLEAIPPAVRGYLDSIRDGATYQFLLDAVPSDSAVLENDTVSRGEALDSSMVPFPRETRFLAMLDWHTGETSYSSERVATTTGVVGGGHQHLRFRVPAMEVSPVAFRLQPADRKAVIHLIRVTARTHAASSVWTWDCTFESLERTPKEGIVVGEPASGNLGVPLALSGSESRFELPFGEEDLAGFADGGEIEIHLNWPESPEYMGILSKIEGAFTELRLAEDTIRELIRSRDHLLDLQDRRLDLWKKTDGEVHALTEERDRLGRLLDERLVLLSGAEERVKALNEENERLGELLQDRLELLKGTQQRVDVLTEERDRMGRLLEDRLQLLKHTEEQVRALTEERSRLSRLLEDRLELLRTAEEQLRLLTERS